MKNNQLVLFGGTELTLAETRGIVTKETFRKAGKAFKGTKDKLGFALNDDGQRIKTADILTFLPVKSKEHDDMADATGLKGEALKLHNIDVRRQAFGTAFQIVSGDMASGNYILANNGLKKAADGTVTLRYKPSAIRVISREMSNEELLAEAMKRGLVVDPNAKK